MLKLRSCAGRGYKRETEILMEKEPEPLEPIEITVDVTEEKEEDTIFIELVQELTDVTVNIGDTATFTCRVIGFPRPTITWLINEKPDAPEKHSPQEVQITFEIPEEKPIEEQPIDEKPLEEFHERHRGPAELPEEQPSESDEPDRQLEAPTEKEITIEVPRNNHQKKHFLLRKFPVEDKPEDTFQDTLELTVDEEPRLPQEIQITFDIPEESTTRCGRTHGRDSSRRLPVTEKPSEPITETTEVVIEEKPEQIHEVEINFEVPEETKPEEVLLEEHPTEEHPVEEQPEETLPEEFPAEDKPEDTFQDTLELTVDEEPRLPQEIQITFDIPEERQPDVEEPMEETPAEELPVTEKPSEPITETTEVVIEEKPEQPQEVEITFEVPEEKQPEEVLLEEQPKMISQRMH
ncbi:hypothetical protein BSL78_02122 [Apostichopus japonicus]|uniref:Ig-like domain-containing protein n=1 Tax=Stichopus japonicus TaxID=307972 RepID=A0A2G8LL10_STIJA|nr:hypothetical protein BSL78_02122 [Apostichopus japonicus]